jgi:hypothetical protein
VTRWVFGMRFGFVWLLGVADRHIPYHRSRDHMVSDSPPTQAVEPPTRHCGDHRVPFGRCLLCYNRLFDRFGTAPSRQDHDASFVESGRFCEFGRPILA